MDNGGSSIKIVKKDRKFVLVADGHTYVPGDTTVRASDGMNVQSWTCIEDCGATINTVMVGGRYVREGAEEKAAVAEFLSTMTALNEPRPRMVAAAAAATSTAASTAVAAAGTARTARAHRRSMSTVEQETVAVRSYTNTGVRLPPHPWE